MIAGASLCSYITSSLDIEESMLANSLLHHFPNALPLFITQETTTCANGLEVKPIMASTFFPFLFYITQKRKCLIEELIDIDSIVQNEYDLF